MGLSIESEGLKDVGSYELVVGVVRELSERAAQQKGMTLLPLAHDLSLEFSMPSPPLSSSSFAISE